MAANRPPKDARQWMPFYVGAYLKNTMALTTEQHGAYLLLILAYWHRQGPLVDDDEGLAAICRLPIARWRAMRPKLETYFLTQKGVWKQARIEAEICKARKVIQVAETNGKKGGRPRKEKTQKKPSGLFLGFREFPEDSSASHCKTNTNCSQPRKTQNNPEKTPSPSPKKDPIEKSDSSEVVVLLGERAVVL